MPYYYNAQTPSTPQERIDAEEERKANIAGAVADAQQRIDEARAAARAARNQAAAAHAAANAARREEEMKQTARAVWKGSDEDFNRAWPTMRLQWMTSDALAEIAARQAESLRAVRSQV